jgi:RecA/RadA recombinase
MSPVRPDDYDEIVARINRKYEGDIRRGDEYEKALRIPTGSLELDIAMGGGIPIGRWSRFYGGYHSTKTLNTLRVIASAQKMGLLAAYYNIEKQYDPVFAGEKLGVDIDDLTVVEGASIEEVGDKMESLFGVVHLHVIDSCSIAVSEDELNADIRDWRPGIAARAWGKVFRRLNERFDHTENTVIMVDQVRTNFKTGGEDAPGDQGSRGEVARGSPVPHRHASSRSRQHALRHAVRDHQGSEALRRRADGWRVLLLQAARSRGRAAFSGRKAVPRVRQGRRDVPRRSARSRTRCCAT